MADKKPETKAEWLEYHRAMYKAQGKTQFTLDGVVHQIAKKKSDK